MLYGNTLDRFIRSWLAYVLSPRGVPDLQECSWGEEHPDKRFLVIRRCAPSSAGLLSFLSTTIGWIRYAVKNGMIPVVDMQTHLNQHLEWWEIGRKNVWEFYFEQPCGYSLKDIRSAKNVVVANKDVSPAHIGLADFLSSEIMMKEVREFVSRYVRIKHLALREFQNPELESALANAGGRVIGVRARGTDYGIVRPHGHHIQPEAKDFIGKIEAFPNDWPIYLVSEDEALVNQMRDAYGSRLIFSRQSLPDYHGGWMPNCRVKGYDRKQEGAGYLKAIYDLSRCPILLAGRNNGTLAACLFSKGFEVLHLFELGVYP